jgi:uncharacterized membrane protein required for colicin V production
MENRTVREHRPFIRGRDFVATMASLASAGFGVMAALAWNEAIKAAVTAIFPAGNTGKVVSLFTYAAIVTTIAVLVVNSLAKLTERLGGEKKL